MYSKLLLLVESPRPTGGDRFGIAPVIVYKMFYKYKI